MVYSNHHIVLCIVMEALLRNHSGDHLFGPVTYQFFIGLYSSTEYVYKNHKYININLKFMYAWALNVILLIGNIRQIPN